MMASQPPVAPSGDRDPAELSAGEQRSFDRLVNFTDAVVAIGITLQLLPLIDIDGPTGNQTVWQIVSTNSGQITAFVLSFVVVILMWRNHNAVFNSLRRTDGTIFWLNLLWLILVVFLPWPTAMYGNASNEAVAGADGVGLFYWWTLAAISGVGSLIAAHARRTPSLLEPGDAERVEAAHVANRWRGIVFFGAFVLIGVVSEFLPTIAPYLAIGLVPANFAISRFRKTSKAQP